MRYPYEMRSSDRIRLAVLCGVLALGCDATDPAPRYGLMLTSPGADATVSDTLVTVEGMVRSPAEGSIIAVGWSVGGQHGTVHSVYNDPPDPAVDSVPFSFTLKVPPGAHVIEFFVSYTTNVQNSLVNEFTNRAFRVYKKPTWRIDAGVAPTLAQRALMLDVSHDGLISSWHANLVMDPGTPSEVVIDNSLSSSVARPWREILSSNSWRLYYPDVLSPGEHRVRVRFYEAGQLADSTTASFVIAIPTVAYSLQLLPTLGGAESRAVAINDAGDIAGWSLDATGKKRAVAWRSTGIEALDTETSEAVAVNNAGAVFGIVTTTSRCGARWDAAGRTTLTTSGSCVDTVRAANDQGSVLARAGGTEILLREDGSTTVMCPYTFGCALFPVRPADVNDDELVVGQVDTPNQSYQVFARGFSPKIPTSFPYAGAGRETAIMEINDAGQYIGSVWSPSGTKLFFGQGEAEPTVLSGALSVNQVPTLIALNEQGDVLTFDYPAQVGYLWRDGRTTRLTLLSSDWRIDGLYAMNDARRIVGHATHVTTGEKRAVVLIPQ